MYADLSGLHLIQQIFNHLHVFFYSTGTQEFENSVSRSHRDEPVNVFHFDYFSLYVESRYFPLTEHLVETLMVCHSLHFLFTLFVLLPSQIFVISQAEPRLPLQLEDAVRPDGEGEEVRMNAWMDELAWKVYFTQDPQ